MLPLILVLTLIHLHRAIGQACDQAIGETIIEDLTSINPIYLQSTTLSADAAITDAGTSLTTTTAASHGSLFFDSPTDFQGTGGFSLKFVLQATSGSGGDAWEAIVSGSANIGSAPPPFGPGSASNGFAGWSRINAFVVEFDAHDSGDSEQDVGASHVAMYLAGTEICKTSIASNLANGDKYTVWLDFDGFATTASVRLSSPNDGTRPGAATLECSVDIWGTLAIASENHVGFAAYNPVSESGAVHELVDSISIADGYKPYDLDDCASYASCTPKSENGLCVTTRGDGATCDIFACSGGWVWDVAGSSCCAFVERTSWVVADGVTGFSEGDVVVCEQTRRTVAFPTTANNCS